MSETLIAPATEWILITTLLSVLEAESGERCPLSTRQLTTWAMDQRFPAQRVRGRWHVRRGDLNAVRKAIGMKVAVRRK